MATNVSLACTQCAYVNSQNPTTNYHGASYYQIARVGSSYYASYLYLQFETLPDAYKYRDIMSASLMLTADRSIASSGTMTWAKQGKTFDETTVTYETYLGYPSAFPQNSSVPSGSGETSIKMYSYSSPQTMGADAKVALQTPSFRLYTTSVSSGEYVNVYTNAAASAKRPYLSVSCGDSPAFIINVTEPAYNGTVLANAPTHFSFSYEKLNESLSTFTDTIVQTEVKLFWKPTGGSWHIYTHNGADTSFDVPAGTFPSSGTIEWYIRGVLDNEEMIDSASRTASVLAESTLNVLAVGGIDSTRPNDTIEWLQSGRNELYNATSSTMQTIARLWCFQFESLDSAYQYREIENAQLNIYAEKGQWPSPVVELYQLQSVFSPVSLTWNNAPAATDNLGRNSFGTAAVSEIVSIPLVYGTDSANQTAGVISKYSAKIATAPALMLKPMAVPVGSESYGRLDIKEPVTITVRFGANTVTSKPVASSNFDGYVNPHKLQTFTWDLEPSGTYDCAGRWTQASATFYWRNGTSGAYTSVAINNSTQACQVAANTFNVGTVQWYVTTTDNKGTTATSDVYTINTQDAETLAYPAAPISTIEDGRSAIKFQWTTVNPNGNVPTGADLQFSTDSTTWNTLATITSSATSVNIAANTFSAGVVYWRVRAKNADSTSGSWSSAVSFVCYNAPPAPIVSATEVPFSTVTWQAEGQQSYRVTVDDKVYGPYFGTEKTFEIPEPLPDGTHTIQVEVQGTFGIWSNPGTTTVSIVNLPGVTLTLSAKFDVDAVLTWTTTSIKSNFYVYRDGVLIARTNAKTFTDRFALGTHEYQVLNNLGQNYTKSNTVTGTLKSCVTRIAELDGGAWIDLKLSDNSDRTEMFGFSKTVVMRSFSGSEWPVAEIGKPANESGVYDVSFASLTDAQRFESLRGKPVVIKSRGGNVMVGVLSNLEKTMTEFYIRYTFTISRTYWRDYLDLTNS